MRDARSPFGLCRRQRSAKRPLIPAIVATVLLVGSALLPTAVPVRVTNAQAPIPPRSASVVGTWRGTSVCLVHPSACHDEVVVYRIAPGNAADSVTMDARKIVGGKEEAMGILACHLAAVRAAFTCAMPRGVWAFSVRGDSLVGELRLPDHTRFRDVRARRAP